MITYICKYVLPTKNGHSLPSLTPEQYNTSTVRTPFNKFDEYDLNWCQTNLSDINYAAYETQMAASKETFVDFVFECDVEHELLAVKEMCEVNNFNEIANYYWVISYDIPLSETDSNTLKTKWDNIGGKTSDPRFAVTNPDHDTHLQTDVTVVSGQDYTPPNNWILLKNIV